MFSKKVNAFKWEQTLAFFFKMSTCSKKKQLVVQFCVKVNEAVHSFREENLPAF